MVSVKVLFDEVSNKLCVKFLEPLNNYNELQDAISDVYKQIMHKTTAEELLMQSKFNSADPLAVIDSVAMMFNDEALMSVGEIALYYSALKRNIPYDSSAVHKEFGNFEIMFTGARCLSQIFHWANHSKNKQAYN